MAEAKTSPCPICKTDVPRDAKTFPFCSERCRLIDLGNWLGGKYVIPGDEKTSTDGNDPQKH